MTVLPECCPIAMLHKFHGKFLLPLKVTGLEGLVNNTREKIVGNFLNPSQWTRGCNTIATYIGIDL